MLLFQCAVYLLTQESICGQFVTGMHRFDFVSLFGAEMVSLFGQLFCVKASSLAWIKSCHHAN